MKPSISIKLVAAAALAVAALGTASAAHARSDVYFSNGVQGAPVYAEPAPIYVQPQPVYVQPRPAHVRPRPVYMQPPVYAGPAEMYGASPFPPAYDADAAYEEERAWRHAEWRRRHWRHHHHDWDQYHSRSRHWDD
jgi:hypothetical protein